MSIREVVNCNKWNKVLSLSLHLSLVPDGTYSTALGIREEVEQIRANVVCKRFYRAMHFSAKRGIAIACRLSVCLSVCNVGEL